MAWTRTFTSGTIMATPEIFEQDGIIERLGEGEGLGQVNPRAAHRARLGQLPLRLTRGCDQPPTKGLVHHVPEGRLRFPWTCLLKQHRDIVVKGEGGAHEPNARLCALKASTCDALMSPATATSDHCSTSDHCPGGQWQRRSDPGPASRLGRGGGVRDAETSPGRSTTSAWPTARLLGSRAASIELGSPSALKTVIPSPADLTGGLASDVQRRGKFLALRVDAGAEGQAYLAWHLARAGWVKWRREEMPATPLRPGKGAVAMRVGFVTVGMGNPVGGFDLTEAGTKKGLGHPRRRPLA
jgi:hypothetical protein